jgi:hypothetical protein
MKEPVYLREIIIRSLKILDIGYITIIYLIIGLFFAKLFDTMYGKFDKEKETKKTRLQHILEISGIMWLSGVVVYIIKNLVELIPSPLDHIDGFDHLRVKELKNAGVFTFIFLYFQRYFKDKIQYFYDNHVGNIF